MSKAPKSLKWIVWSLAALFYLYEYFLRVSPSIVITDLMQTFRVDATAIGLLAAFYFYTYAPMQIPVGLLTDRFGARRLMTFAAILSGIGALFFGLSEKFSYAAFGRFIIGFGASFGFVGIVYVVTHWFSLRRRGLMIGLANTVGMLGAILGQGPLRKAIDSHGWREVTLFLGAFGVVLGLIIYLIMRDDPKKKETPKGTKTEEKLISNLKTIIKNRHSWIISIGALFFYVSTATFADLWGISYIHESYKVSLAEAGFIVSMIFVGWAVGGPAIGMLSDRLDKKKAPILVATFMGLLLMLYILYFSPPLWALYPLFFLVGFVSSAELLCFSYCIDINPIYAKGTAIAFTNFIVVIGTAVFQPFVGYLLDLNWTGQMVEGIRTYSPHAYKIAMSTFPISFALAFLINLFIKTEKRHESHGF